MNELLVSVRSVSECETAIGASVDIVDVKEPLRGSLGAAEASTISSIVHAAGGRCRVSVALGELTKRPALTAVRLIAGVGFAKIGLAGCSGRPEWEADWQRALAALPATVKRVAVAYADSRLANSPDWRRILAASTSSGCSVFLVDTFNKSQGMLLDWLDLSELTTLQTAVHKAGLKLALAGSLNVAAVRILAQQIQPDILAVRTAACNGGRNGVVCAQAIRNLRAAISNGSTPGKSSEIFCKK